MNFNFPSGFTTIITQKNKLIYSTRITKYPIQYTHVQWKLIWQVSFWRILIIINEGDNNKKGM